MQEEDDKIFAQNLPKIELHLHLDGSLSPGNFFNFWYSYLFNGRFADTLTLCGPPLERVASRIFHEFQIVTFCALRAYGTLEANFMLTRF